MGARWNPLPAAHPPPPPLPEPGVGEMVGVGSPVGVGVPDGVTPPSAFTWKEVEREKFVATVAPSGEKTSASSPGPGMDVDPFR